MMLSRIRSYLGGRFWGRAFASGGLQTWMSEEVVRRYINSSVTGSPDLWPIEWLRQQVPSPFAAAVSLGCGEGALERDLLSKNLCGRILGIDISSEALNLARERAKIGPSRTEWSKDLIQGASEVFERLPAAARRSRRLKLPVDWRDPTEAVRSSEILDAVSRHFVITQRRDYGGNFLSVIYPHLHLSSLTAEARASLLHSLIDAEREYLAEGHASYYTVLMATPR